MGCREAIKELLKILREDHLLHSLDEQQILKALDREDPDEP